MATGLDERKRRPVARHFLPRNRHTRYGDRRALPVPASPRTVLRTSPGTAVARRAGITAAVIDSQFAKTTESGGPRGYGAGKQVLGRKRHLVVDVKETPLALRVHTANVQDRNGAPVVIEEPLRRAPTVCKLFADCGYQGPNLRAALEDLGISDLIEIVERPKRVQEFTVLYRQWVVERSFSWMGRCRRLAKDFERTLESSLAWWKLAACQFLVRRVGREQSA